jgi:glyoxylase-like metal-dependent hydrolase (beta-lactamase superfamily II)
MGIPLLKLFVPPKPTVRLKDGEVIKLAGREWFAVHTPGHTLDHLCLHDPESGLLLSGDHVLPTITPHIAGVGAGRDPLTAFVDSLDKVAALEGVQKVLPAHGHPFDDLQGRVDSIKHHHEERMDKLRELSASLGPSTVTEYSHHLFRKARWGYMAESETYAHLEHLRLSGRAERHDRDGVLVYSLG